MNNEIKTKFFFIFNGYASKNKSITGGESRSVALANYIYKEGYRVSFCCPNNFHIAQDMKDLEPLMYRTLPFEEKFYNNLILLFFIYCYRVFVSIFKILKNKPDVLVSTSHLFPDVVPLFFLRKKGIKFVVIVHHILSEQKRVGIRSYLAIKIEKICFYIIKKCQPFILTLSESTKDKLVEKYCLKENSIYLTKNGLDLSMIDSITVPSEKKYDICFCARLSKTKGVHDLVDIISLVKKEFPSVTCAVIGEGDERSNLESRIKKNDLSKNISLLGYLDEKDKIGVMKSSKVFVLPSHEEGWGIVIGEAMACGVPVIVYKLEDILKIWNDNVIWVECFDVVSFATNVIELLNNKEKREVYIAKSLNFSRTLEWDSILKKEMHAILSNKSFPLS